jgi:hypothetical protein
MRGRFPPRGFRAGEADTEDRVGAKPGLVRRPVELNQYAINGQLVLRIQAGERVADPSVHCLDSLKHPSTPEPRSAIAPFDRLMRTGGRSGWNRRPAYNTALQRHLDLDGRIASAVENLAGVNIVDRGHRMSLHRGGR